jgi:hypothetical protein
MLYNTTKHHMLANKWAMLASRNCFKLSMMCGQQLVVASGSKVETPIHDSIRELIAWECNLECVSKFERKCWVLE